MHDLYAKFTTNLMVITSIMGFDDRVLNHAKDCFIIL
jgi:hypothetical protein